MSGSIFDALCQPFIWDESDQDEPETKAYPGHRLDREWINEVPSLILSDTEDDSSVPEYPLARRKAQHEKGKQMCSNHTRHVTFGEAHIREHPMIPGVESACCAALPLSLDWGYQDERVYDIDAYEIMREQSGRKARGNVPRISTHQRQRILENSFEYEPRDPDSLEMYDPSASHAVECTAISHYKDEPQRDEYDFIASGCNALESWGMFDGGCNYEGGFPSMTVQILED